MTISSLSGGVVASLLARCVIVVKGWTSRFDESLWWMKKCAKGDRQEHPARRDRGMATVILLYCQHKVLAQAIVRPYQYQPLPNVEI